MDRRAPVNDGGPPYDRRMPRTIYYVASSLDGFIADENDGLDWLLQFGFEAYQEHYDRFVSGVGAVVMGSATYEFVLAEGAEAWTYTQPGFVLSGRELPAVADADIRFRSGDIGAIHAEAVAAAAGQDVWVVGGGNVAAQYLEAGLLDELHVTFMPIVLGSGKRLLPVTAPTSRLTLLNTTHFDGGAVELQYSLR